MCACRLCEYGVERCVRERQRADTRARVRWHNSMGWCETCVCCVLCVKNSVYFSEVCMCVRLKHNMYAREREKENVCMCVLVSRYTHTHTHTIRDTRTHPSSPCCYHARTNTSTTNSSFPPPQYTLIYIIFSHTPIRNLHVQL